MNDEKYVYMQDIREKKSIANSARNTRSHCGKGGKIKLPSDYLTHKELCAMNGEVKEYRLNKPMKWEEFKALPDDLKGMYVRSLRERFDVPDIEIGKMLGADKDKISRYFKALGLRRNCRRGNVKWDTKKWSDWLNGFSFAAVEEPVDDGVEQGLVSLEDITEPVSVSALEFKTFPTQNEKVIPESGTMSFEGQFKDVFDTITTLLGGVNARITVSWDCIRSERE